MSQEWARNRKLSVEQRQMIADVLDILAEYLDGEDSKPTNAVLALHELTEVLQAAASLTLQWCREVQEGGTFPSDAEREEMIVAACRIAPLTTWGDGDERVRSLAGPDRENESVDSGTVSSPEFERGGAG